MLSTRCTQLPAFWKHMLLLLNGPEPHKLPFLCMSDLTGRSNIKVTTWTDSTWEMRSWFWLAFLFVCRLYFVRDFFFWLVFGCFVGRDCHLLSTEKSTMRTFSRGEYSFLFFKIIYKFRTLRVSESSEKTQRWEAIFLTWGNTVCTCSVCHLRLHCLWCGM